MDRVAFINSMIGTEYRLGAQGAGAVDCYSCATAIQSALFDRAMPAFEMPALAGRSAIAAAIAVNPERARWREVPEPVDGALITMARNVCGYHLGTWLAEDGGIVVHAIEECGVIVDTIQSLQTVGWRRFRYHVPA
jgi:hypothetical protein